MEKNYLILYPSCIVVKGAVRSTISDFEATDYHYIPNGMADLIQILKEIDFEQFYLNSDPEEQPIILEYRDYLLKNNLAFFTNDPAMYPDMPQQYFASSRISTAIIDRSKSSKYNLIGAILALNKLNCRHLQFRFYDPCTITDLNEIMNVIQEIDILSVDIFIPFTNLKTNVLKNFLNQWTKIKFFAVHSAPITEVVIFNKKTYYTSNMGNFVYTSERISSAQNCGCVSKDYFTVNIGTFMESLNFNTCLNNKISIDENGKIKNCPSLNHDFGDFEHESLEAILKNEKFLSLQSITKDQIKVCKDCEHRHFCTDCRAFVEDLYDKPKKCNYDPYRAQWN